MCEFRGSNGNGSEIFGGQTSSSISVDTLLICGNFVILCVSRQVVRVNKHLES